MSEESTRRPPCERCGRRLRLYADSPHCTSCFEYLHPGAVPDPGKVQAQKAKEKIEKARELKRREGVKTAFGYIRVSTRDQAEGGLGLGAQREQIEDLYARKYKPAGYAWGGIYEDRAVSARKRWFAERPRAQALMKQLDRGDVVLVTRLDRAFRRTRDLLTVAEKWQTEGVSLFVMQLGMDFSSSLGKLVCTIMAAVAEWEVETITERTREAKDEIRRRDGVVAGAAPYGTRTAGKKGKKRLELDLNERELGVRVIHLRDIDRLSWRKIEKTIYQEGRRSSRGRIVSFSTLRLYYQLEKAIHRREVAAAEAAVAQGLDPSELDPMIVRHGEIRKEAIAIPTGIPETWFRSGGGLGKQGGKVPETA